MFSAEPPEERGLRTQTNCHLVKLKAGKKSDLNGIRTHIGYRRGIAQVMGLNPVQAWILFQPLISQLLKLCA